MPTDIEIAQATPLTPITDIATAAGIPADALETYGRYKAKVAALTRENGPHASAPSSRQGKLILVTAMSPTPAGEGKTTTTVGLADALSLLGKRTMVALREPSLGPVFGVKGGAAGGGYAQVVPMEDINLHFTGDMHAITAANNLLAAMLDNHLYQGNALDVERVVWRRCLDMNDRQLRRITDGVGGRPNGVERDDGFDITAASEVMAVLCLATGLDDLKARLGRMVVGYTASGTPVSADDLNATGAMTALLRDALKPNLVQTLEHTPAFVHGGPFANIAHGCNSVVATRTALGLADYVVTEAGFGADLGAEKFCDIVCRQTGLRPDAAVVVATVRALKRHGGAADASVEDVDAVGRGLPNLLQHVATMTDVFGVPAVVAVNRFPADTDAELALVREACARAGVQAAMSEVWARGGEGGRELAAEVVRLADEPSDFRFSYEVDQPLTAKIEAIARRIYRADGVRFSDEALEEAQRLEADGFGGLPVCVAKTQYSFSDNAKLLGAPRGFTITVQHLRVSAGAGFVVALTGAIMTMPGLPAVPSAEKIDVDAQGVIWGLF